MTHFKSITLASVGGLLIGLSVVADVPNPMVGLIVGGFMVLVGICPLIRRWEKPESDDEDVKRQIDFNQ